MTLKQAQKQYDDALYTEVTHKPNAMTVEDLIALGKTHYRMRYNKPCKVLFAQVGKRKSRIITSLKAATEL